MPNLLIIFSKKPFLYYAIIMPNVSGDKDIFFKEKKGLLFRALDISWI
jgi:hypothetical protein